MCKRKMLVALRVAVGLCIDKKSTAFVIHIWLCKVVLYVLVVNKSSGLLVRSCHTLCYCNPYRTKDIYRAGTNHPLTLPPPLRLGRPAAVKRPIMG